MLKKAAVRVFFFGGATVDFSSGPLTGDGSVPLVSRSWGSADDIGSALAEASRLMLSRAKDSRERKREDF